MRIRLIKVLILPLGRRMLAVIGLVLAATTAIAQPAEEPLDRVTATGYRVLLIGNSHSSKNNLPGLLATLITEGQASTNVHTETAPRWAFLADRLGDNVTQKKLESDRWTHVILQAQKYSTSGRYYYPTDAAEEWIRRVKLRGSVPILFPEWARRGNDEEGQRVHALHMSIASRESACVAPVGIAWQIALDANRKLRLHASDGNHASRKGALLTAYVLYQAITGQRADDLPTVDTIKVDTETQAALRSAASEAYRLLPDSACTASLTM